MNELLCRWLAALAIILAVLFWPLDAWLGSVYFNNGRNFLDSLHAMEPSVIWSRSFPVFLLLLLAYVCLFVSHKSAQSKLLYKATWGGAGRTLLGNEVEKEEQARLRSMAYRDHLTGLYNRRRTEELLQSIHRTEQLRHAGMAVLFCDIDHFKRVNTEFGHPAGDDVLKKLAGVLGHHFRRDDVVGRWGGEEFLIILTNLERNEVEVITENLRKQVEKEIFPHVERLTISIGVAALHADECPDSLVKRADRALRKAKADGRNRWHDCDREEASQDRGYCTV